MIRALLLAWLLAAGAAGAAQAGRSCEPELPSTEAVVQGIALAERTAEALDASGASVVVLARAGQDLSAHGLRWSHLGFVYRSAEGPWRVLHKLNHCGSERAGLFRQGLAEFFLDSPHRYEAAYAVLSPALQQRLLPLLQDDAAASRWHESRYNLVAHPWATRYQQSNQWLIETLAGVMVCPLEQALPAPPPEGVKNAWGGPARPCDPAASDRPRAQAWLRLQGYEPTVLRLGTFTRLGARMSRANIAFDDHPDAQRYAGRIATVGADSVFVWLARSGHGESQRLIP